MCVLLGGGHSALCISLVVPLGPLGWFVSLCLVLHAQLWCLVVVVVVEVVLVVVGFREGVFALWWGWGGRAGGRMVVVKSQVGGGRGLFRLSFFFVLSLSWLVCGWGGGCV